MKTITMKTKWEDITYSEFVMIDQIFSADIPENYKESNLIAVLTGEEEDTIASLPAMSFQKLVNKLKFLLDPPKKTKHKKNYTVNGHKYILQGDLTKITTAQYIDYMSYTKEDMTNLSKLTSVFLIPEGHNYNDGYEMCEVQRDVEDMPFLDVQAICFFMQTQLALYMIATADSLERDLKKQGKSKKEIEAQTASLRSTALRLLS